MNNLLGAVWTQPKLEIGYTGNDFVCCNVIANSSLWVITRMNRSVTVWRMIGRKYRRFE